MRCLPRTLSYHNDRTTLRTSDALNIKKNLVTVLLSIFLAVFVATHGHANDVGLSQKNNNTQGITTTNPKPDQAQLRSSLISWLSLQTQNETSEIEEKLTLNRSLEKMLCPGTLVFSYVESNKSLILANCENHWRRFIKQPSWLQIKINEPVKTDIAARELNQVFLLKKDVAKGMSITQEDLQSDRLELPDFSSFDIAMAKGSPVVASKDLTKGQPLASDDVLIGEKVVVAKNSIPSGSSITEKLVSLEYRYVDVPKDAVKGEESWSYMEINRRLLAGEIVRERHLRKAKLVRRKDPVTLIHKSPALQIITTGTALQDGYYGQSVKVLNTESGKNVMGVVTGRGKVVIDSEG